MFHDATTALANARGATAEVLPSSALESATQIVAALSD